jgi:nitrate/nitrite transport system ATP-binding protein
VDNPLPKTRQRNEVHHHPLFYGVRNHIIDFLVTRSRTFAAEMDAAAYDRRHVPVVRPGLPEPVLAAAGDSASRGASHAWAGSSPQTGARSTAA